MEGYPNPKPKRPTGRPRIHRKPKNPRKWVRGGPMPAQFANAPKCTGIKLDGMVCRHSVTRGTQFCKQHAPKPEVDETIPAPGAAAMTLNYSAVLPHTMRVAYEGSRESSQVSSLREEIALARGVVYSFLRDNAKTFTLQNEKNTFTAVEILLKQILAIGKLVREHLEAEAMQEQIISKRDASILAARIADEWLGCVRRYLPEPAQAQAIGDMRRRLLLAVGKAPTTSGTQSLVVHDGGGVNNGPN